jgi:hypothetical protein
MAPSSHMCAACWRAVLGGCTLGRLQVRVLFDVSFDVSLLHSDTSCMCHVVSQPLLLLFPNHCHPPTIVIYVLSYATV